MSPWPRPPEPVPTASAPTPQGTAPGGPRRSLWLMPGALSFVRDGSRLRTLLGSCVAVAVWHPRQRVGGLCHFLLPSRHATAPGVVHEVDGRFASDALEMLVLQMAASGADRRQFVAHVAGGAHCFGGASANAIDIGVRNAETALAWCAAHELSVRTRDTGDRVTRLVEFDTATGVFQVRQGEPIPFEDEGAQPMEVGP